MIGDKYKVTQRFVKFYTDATSYTPFPLDTVVTIVDEWEEFWGVSHNFKIRYIYKQRMDLLDKVE